MPTGAGIVSYLPALRVPSVVPTVDGEEAMSLTYLVRSALPAQSTSSGSVNDLNHLKVLALLPFELSSTIK